MEGFKGRFPNTMLFYFELLFGWLIWFFIFLLPVFVYFNFDFVLFCLGDFLEQDREKRT